MSKPVSPDQTTPRCARCRKHPVLADYRPFCSKRCADADLGHWLTGGYVITGRPAEDAEDIPDPLAPDEDADEH